MAFARIIAILIAYAAAVVTAAAAMSLLLIIHFPFTQDMGPPGANLVDFEQDFYLFLFLMGLLSFTPGMIAIAAAEALGLRAWPFHALGGALVIVCPQFLLVDGSELYVLDFFLELTLAGALAGLVYWSLIGRTAGLGCGARQQRR